MFVPRREMWHSNLSLTSEQHARAMELACLYVSQGVPSPFTVSGHMAGFFDVLFLSVCPFVRA